MRTETEMMNLILETAQQDDRIRAVVMNGSRANPEAPKDKFQDYDIIYVVDQFVSYMRDHDWIDRFGKRIMLQMPETMRNPIGDGRFVYLMLFEDGNRIDLQLIPTERMEDLLEQDSETILLLDKDGRMPPFPAASDSDYHIRKPSALEYASCCNNFWWCSQNVAKGIRRDEVPYAMFMLHSVVKEELHGMIEWYIGVNHDFAVSAGKLGKYFKRYLSEEQYQRYEKLYADAQHESIWEALSAAGDLFRELAGVVGESLGFAYPQEDDDRMTAYLKRVRE